MSEKKHTTATRSASAIVKCRQSRGFETLCSLRALSCRRQGHGDNSTQAWSVTCKPLFRLGGGLTGTQSYGEHSQYSFVHAIAIYCSLRAVIPSEDLTADWVPRAGGGFAVLCPVAASGRLCMCSRDLESAEHEWVRVWDSRN